VDADRDRDGCINADRAIPDLRVPREGNNPGVPDPHEKTERSLSPKSVRLSAETATADEGGCL
jgi:hypothetical protein